MIADLLLPLWMTYQRHTAWRGLVRAVATPAAMQLDVLRRILRQNCDTTYGRRHDFAAIDSYDAYVQSVPIVDYEILRPYIAAQMRSGEAVLTAAAPCMYARTSGTTGEPKYLPLLQEELDRQRRHTALLTSRQYAFDRSAFAGKLWVMAAAAEEGRLENGLPWGSASGQLYASMSPVLASRCVIPPQVFAIEDHELKYRTVLRLALAEPNISYLSAANPSTLARLCALANEYGPELAEEIACGKFGAAAVLPPGAAAAVTKRLRADPGRAEELRAIFRRAEPASFAELWPRMRLVPTWTGGNCGITLEAVRLLLPPVARVVELGYLSSEFRGTLTVDCETGAGLPTLQDYFFEFIEPQAWEAGNRECRLLHQLESGCDYFVIVTTPSGLYRYFINDIVRVTGSFGNTPTIRFLQKGKGVTSITGEKLYESQVVETLDTVGRRLTLRPRFHLMLADVAGQGYRLLLELDAVDTAASGAAEWIDQTLCQLNDEYRAKRASGRLKPLAVTVLRAGAGEAYRAYCIDQGQKEGQIKPLTLQYAHECGFPFQSYLREE